MSKPDLTFGYSQCQAVGEPSPKTWDDYERGCLMTYGGGHREPETIAAFKHGMGTIFNLLRDEFPEAHLCKRASELKAACDKALDTLVDWDRDDGETGDELREVLGLKRPGG
jgi:hypothetical protein